MPLFNTATNIATGTVVSFGSTTIPSDYLLCDGSAVNRTTYATLFAIINTTFGVGDGSTTFNVPDLRQRFILGQAASGTGSSFAGTGGTVDHVHAADPPSTTTGAPSATISATALTGSAASPTHTHSVDIASFNTGSANPPFLTLVFMVKI